MLIAAGVAAILYTDGHGIHLSANSIANEGPGPEVEDLVHFWDETFSHIEAVLGWFGLVACFCWAEADRIRAGEGEGIGAGVEVTAATVGLLGWSFFTATVEGGTWPIELAATAAFAFWLLRTERRPVLTASGLSFIAAAALIGVWAIWQGGVPQFSESGFL